MTVRKVEIAAIDPDFTEAFASVPDGIRWSMPDHGIALEAQ